MAGLDYGFDITTQSALPAMLEPTTYNFFSVCVLHT